MRDQPVYDIEAELKKALAEKAQEIRDSTQRNEKDLQQAAPPASTPDDQQPSSAGQQPPSQKMLADFKKASDDQLKRLEGTEQETEEQVMQPLQDMSLMQAIIEDINRYKNLYAAQQELAKQARAYQRPAPLSREDQLALKDLAAQQKGIGDALDELEQKMWDDGKAAMEKFPKAARSAQDIADKMGDLKLQTMANQTTAAMLAGNGSDGAQLAESLRVQMEKLFTQCNAKGAVMAMNNELDQYLSIQRGLNPGKSFKQMMQCHKFGSGFKPGMGAQGNGGRNGYSIISGQNPNVLGNEALPGPADRTQKGGNGKGQPPPKVPAVTLDKSDVAHDVNPVNRESEAVQSETIIQQYSDLVDEYFMAITKEPKKEKKP